MKKSAQKKRPYLLVLFLGAFSATVVIFLYVSLNIEIENLTKLKADLKDKLITKKNITTKLQVEIQKLESEERITAIAENTLEMKKFNESGNTIEIDRNKAQQISKIIENKYE